MAGLVKAKKYDWKDSNLALFGSDTERKVGHVVEARKQKCYCSLLFSFTGEKGFGTDGASVERSWRESGTANLAHRQVQGISYRTSPCKFSASCMILALKTTN